MDFETYDPSGSTVLIENVTVHDQEDDDLSAPFIDENPCLVCGHKAFANFIDLTYGTSCTSQTSIPVKRKLKEILRRVWDPKRENQILCLACYDLVDRFDVLESQLNTIRENIEEKYQKTSSKRSWRNKVTSVTAKRRNKQPNNRKKSQKKIKTDENEDDNIDDNGGGYSGDLIDTGDNLNDSDYIAIEESNIDELKQPLQQQNAIQQFSMLDAAQPEPPPNPNVYDEHHQLLQRGEKIRLGKGATNEHGVEVFLCAYCPQIWPDIALLHSHVHSIHQPEVVDVAIPPELGLGNTVNCGVEIQNCQEPPENPKPWSCLFCDAAFRARTNMSSHFKEKHTPHKPFACSDCGESFRKGIDLNRHKLYFCPHRTTTFAPKRKYKKRETKEKCTKIKRADDE